MFSRRSVGFMLALTACLAALTFGLSALFVGPPAMTADGITYNTSAIRLLKTGIYSSYSLNLSEVRQPDAYQVPGYSLLLAGIHSLLPPNSSAEGTLAGAIGPITAMHFLAALATVALIAATADRIGGRRLGWSAGIIGALYLPFGAESMSTWPENVRLVFSAMLLYLGVGLNLAEKDRAPYWMAAFGVVGGATVMLQPSIALWLLVPIAFWAWKHRSDTVRAVSLAAVGVLGIGLVMSPWVVRNALVLGEFVPLTKHAGSVWIDSIGGIELTPQEDAVYLAAVAQGKDGYREVAFDRLGAKWQQSPSGFITWKLGGAAEFLGKPWTSQENPFSPLGPDMPKVAGPNYRIMGKQAYTVWTAVITTIHLAVIALAAIGVWLKRKKAVVWLLVSGPLYALAVNTIIFPWQRYFYPWMPAVIVLAGITVATAAGTLGQRRGAREALAEAG